MHCKSELNELRKELRAVIERAIDNNEDFCDVFGPVNIIGTTIHVHTSANYYDFGEEGKDYIEFNENDISLDTTEKIDKLINYIVLTPPKPSFYANAWLKIFIGETEIFYDCKQSTDFNAFILSLPDNINNIIECRHNSDDLYLKLYLAKKIFEPLLFIELRLRNKEANCYVKFKYIDDKEKLFKKLKMDLYKYNNYLLELNLLSHFRNFINSLSFDLKSNNNHKANNGISPANYAFLLMVLTALTGEKHRYAMYQCWSILFKYKKRKQSKYFVHILCIIIYVLLSDHPTIKRPKGKAHRRKITSQILEALSPKNQSGKPYYSIDERGVEYALTGK